MQKQTPETAQEQQNKAVKKLSPKKALEIIKRDKYHTAINEKMKEVTLGYFGEAKNNKPKSDAIYNKYKKQWTKYCTSINATQKLVRAIPKAFDDRIAFIMEHAERQIAQEKEAKKVKILGIDGSPINPDSNGIIH